MSEVISAAEERYWLRVDLKWREVGKDEYTEEQNKFRILTKSEEAQQPTPNFSFYRISPTSTLQGRVTRGPIKPAEYSFDQDFLKVSLH